MVRLRERPPEGPRAWLLRDDEVLASAEVATSHHARRKGLLGRSALDGVLVLPRTRSVHTFGMRFAIDAAYLAGDGTVLRVVTLRPNRLGPTVLRAARVVEAEAGRFGHWGVVPGQVLEVRT